MTKKLEQIQEENREDVIMACHPNAGSYGEAILLDAGCSPKVAKEQSHQARLNGTWGSPVNKVLRSMGRFGNFFIGSDGSILRESRDRFHYFHYHTLGFKWDLAKETLEEQSEETQRAIHKLLCKQ